MKTDHATLPIVPLSLWFLALLCAVSPFDDYRLETGVGAVVLSLCFGFAVLARGLKTGWSVPKSGVLVLAAVMLGWVIASVLWSEVKPVTLIYIGMFSVMFVTFLSQTIAGQDGFYKWGAILAAPVFAALGIWAIVQNFFLNEYFWGQAQHPLADPSSLGGLLCLPFMLAVAGMFGFKRTGLKALSLILALILAGGIMATVARGPVFALIPAVAALIFMMWPQVKSGWKYALALIVGVGLVFTSLTLNPNKTHDLGSEISNTVTFEGDISNGRFYLWNGTWDMIKERPLLGTGFGTYSLYFPEYKDERYTAAVHHAHNDPLQYWAELGILGPVLFYALAIAGLVRTIKALKKLRPEQVTERTMIAGGFAALTALVVQAHVSFLFYNLSILFVAGFVLALWFYGTRLALAEDEVGTREQESAGMINLIGLSLPFLMIGGLFVSVMLGDHYTNKAAKSLSAHDMDGFVENINKSGNISNGMNFRSYLLAVNVPISILMAEKSALSDEDKRALYDQATGYMEKVLSINPRSDAAYFYMAKIQEIAGVGVVPEGAPTREELYKKSLALNSMNLQSRLSLYDLYKVEGRPLADLIAIMEPAKDMFFNSRLASNYYGELAKLYVEAEDYGKVEGVLHKTQIFHKRSEASLKRMSNPVFEALFKDESAL